LTIAPACSPSTAAEGRRGARTMYIFCFGKKKEHQLSVVYILIKNYKIPWERINFTGIIQEFHSFAHWETTSCYSRKKCFIPKRRNVLEKGKKSSR
jgi:hypothetical protein